MARSVSAVCVAVVLGVVLGMFAGTGHANDAEPWAGEWQTFWRTGQAVMVLDQDGTTVTGTYEPGKGRIQGEIEGTILRGTWSQPGAQGGLVFAIAEDGKTFTGRFDNGEYWNGERASENLAGRLHFTASFSPRETLRTVMASANAAVFQRDAAAARFYEPLLLYQGTTENARNRNQQRRMLFQILNLSTFRILEAPGRVDGDTATFDIGPVDSDVRYTIRFRQGEDSVWRILLEPVDKLTRIRDEMLDSLGVASNAEAMQTRRDNPRQTMLDFLSGMSEWDTGGRKRALATLDLSYLPLHLRSIEGPIVADYLRQIINRIGYVIWQEIPNDPDASIPYVHYRHPNGSVAIERQVGEEKEPPQWRFSAATLQASPELFAAVQNMPVVLGVEARPPVTQFFQLREAIRNVAPWMLNRSLLFENWQWGALVAATAVAALAGWLAGLMLRLALAIGVTEENAHFRHEALRKLLWPVRFATVFFLLLILLAKLGLLHSGLGYGAQVVGLLSTAATIALIFQVIGVVAALFFRRAEKTPGYVDEIVISLTSGLLKLLTVVLGIFFAADVVGLPYEGVITGLGVGGIALAFAARDTVSNMLGGAILMADRPFKRGDMVTTQGELALVENVGLRSTRLRTLDDSLLIIPNAQLSDKAIINWGRRRKRRVLLHIGLTYDTPREKLDKFVDKLKEIYLAQPRADSSNYTAGLVQFGASSIDIELRGYFNVYGYDAQVAAQHALVGDIVDLAKQLKVSFAFPTRTIHMSTDQPEGAEPSHRASQADHTSQANQS